jgi:imidazolonepropionase-like amidohydrolase
LSQTGGHADDHFPCGVSLPFINASDLPASVVDGAEPMRQRVRELIRAGADWIKLRTSGGVLSPGDVPHHPTFTLDEIRRGGRESGRTRRPTPGSRTRFGAAWSPSSTGSGSMATPSR